MPEIVAEIQLSAAEDVAPVGPRIADGTLTGVSIGYRVAGWTARNESGQRIKTATRVTLTEITLTSNPADPRAGIRTKGKTMPNDTEELTRDALIEQVRTALGLPEDWGDDLPDDATPGTIRAAAREAMQASQTPRVRITRDHADPDVITRRKSDTMAFRMAGGTLPDEAREFAAMSALDFARDALTRSGESVRGLSADDVFQRAGTHTTSDFPLVVSNAMNKVALASYQAADTP